MERDTGTEIGDSRHSKDPPPADDDVKPVDIDKVCNYTGSILRSQLLCSICRKPVVLVSHAWSRINMLASKLVAPGSNLGLKFWRFWLKLVPVDGNLFQQITINTIFIFCFTITHFSGAIPWVPEREPLGWGPDIAYILKSDQQSIRTEGSWAYCCVWRKNQY